MEKAFEIYISKIVNRLECSEEEKLEIAEELQDHLLLLKREFLKKGYSNEEAVNLAISSFGSENKISSGLQNVMFPYLKFIKSFVVALCGMLTVLLIKKGIALWNMGTNVDGDGIGVYFLIFEINDRVPEQSIPGYAVGFFVAGAATALVPLVLIGKKILNFK